MTRDELRRFVHDAAPAVGDLLSEVGARLAACLPRSGSGLLLATPGDLELIGKSIAPLIPEAIEAALRGRPSLPASSKPRYRFRGPWDGLRQYQVDDAVTFAGRGFVATTTLQALSPDQDPDGRWWKRAS